MHPREHCCCVLPSAPMFVTPFHFNTIVIFGTVCSSHFVRWCCTAWQDSNNKESVWTTQIVTSKFSPLLLKVAAALVNSLQLYGPDILSQLSWKWEIDGFIHLIHLIFFFFKGKDLQCCWLSSWITYYLEFERESQGPCHKRLALHGSRAKRK